MLVLTETDITVMELVPVDLVADAAYSICLMPGLDHGDLLQHHLDVDVQRHVQADGK